MYQTSQMSNRSTAWIRQMLHDKQPFFAWIGPHAPHYPADPAPWHQGAFAGKQAPRTPAFGAAAPDHHRMVAQEPPIDARCADCVDQQFRDRWASLLSVDAMVGALIGTLEQASALDSTYMIYSSDRAS